MNKALFCILYSSVLKWIRLTIKYKSAKRQQLHQPVRLLMFNTINTVSINHQSINHLYFTRVEKEIDNLDCIRQLYIQKIDRHIS